MSSPGEILLASAGSGKTFQLSLRYAGLVLRGVSVKNILAATFTRKSAGEIQSRILARIAGAAEGGDDLEDLRKFLKQPDLKAADCGEALVRVVNDLAHLRIKTLDGWFAQLARGFAPDLGLDAAWAMLEEVEDQALRTRSVEELLGELDPDQRRVLLSDLQKGGSKAGVISQLMSSIEIGRSRQRWATADAWDQIDVPKAPSKTVWQALLDDADGWELPQTKAGKPDKRWGNAVHALVECVREEDWLGAVSNTVFQRSLDNGTYFNQPVPDHLLEPFGIIRDRLAHELLRQVRKQNVAQAELLSRFGGIHQELQRAQGGLRFDDLSALLAEAASGEQAFDLSYRLDAQLDHVLLDEYQDTNALQHASLDRTMQELATPSGEDRSIFVVGDPKQSIYGFRQAEPRLLIGLGDHLGIVPEGLDRNYRSSPVVLSAVNKLFSQIAEATPFEDDKKKHVDRLHLRKAAADWQESFTEHTSSDSNASMPGAVRIWQAPEGDEYSKDQLLDYAADHVARLHEQAPKAVIAVLTRSKDFGQQMIARLALRGVAAAGDGGHSITDCELVRAVLALLYLVDHPGDGYAWAMVTGSKLAGVLELEVDDGLKGGQALAHRVRTEILSKGLGPWLADLRDRLGELTPFEHQRLESLITAAHAWSARIDVRLGTFFDHVLGMKVGVESDALVRVVTIHASKGLEYDAVVLPELINLLEKPPTVVSSRPDAYGKIEAMSLYQKREIRALSGDLKTLHEIEDRAQLHDTLCTLYVAMTRARHSVDLILPAENPTKWNKRTFAGIVRSTFVLDLDSEPVWSHPDCNDDWPSALEDKSVAQSTSKSKPLELKAGGPLRSLVHRSPSATEGGHSKTAAAWLDAIPAGAADWGTLAHEWLSQIEWLEAENTGPTVEDLTKLAACLGISQKVVPGVQKLLIKALGASSIRELLSAPMNSDTSEVWCERRFSVLLAEEGNEEIWNGSIDRAVLHLGAQGIHEKATIIDYKTDSVSAEDLEGRVKHYAPQLEAYRRVISALTGLDRNDITLKLAFLVPGVVVDC